MLTESRPKKREKANLWRKSWSRSQEKEQEEEHEQSFPSKKGRNEKGREPEGSNNAGKRKGERGDEAVTTGSRATAGLMTINKGNFCLLDSRVNFPY